MPSADKDELTTDQTVISGLKGVTLGSIGDGIVNCNRYKLMQVRAIY